MVSRLNSTKATLIMALDRGWKNFVWEGTDNNGLSTPACGWEEVAINNTLLLCSNSSVFPDAGEGLDLASRLYFANINHRQLDNTINKRKSPGDQDRNGQRHTFSQIPRSGSWN